MACIARAFGDPAPTDSRVGLRELIPPPHGLSARDFEEIEAAVMETERGRWFLAEFARRCRAEDTARILASIERLERRAAEAEAAQAEARREAVSAAQRIQ